MSKVVELTKPVDMRLTENGNGAYRLFSPYGDCPECGEPGQHIREWEFSADFMYCATHKLVWYIGNNVIEVDHEPTEAEIEDNKEFLLTLTACQSLTDQVGILFYKGLSKEDFIAQAEAHIAFFKNNWHRLNIPD